MCAEQTPNIVEFRECMGDCRHRDDFSKKPETKDDAPEEQDKESAEAL